MLDTSFTNRNYYAVIVYYTTIFHLEEHSEFPQRKPQVTLQDFFFIIANAFIFVRVYQVLRLVANKGVYMSDSCLM